MINSTHKSKRKNNLFSKMFKEVTENKFFLEQERVCIEFCDCMMQNTILWDIWYEPLVAVLPCTRAQHNVTNKGLSLHHSILSQEHFNDETITLPQCRHLLVLMFVHRVSTY